MQRFKQVRSEFVAHADYPQAGLGAFLQDAARLIQSSLVGTRVIYTGLGGWDTHSNQIGSHERILGTVDQSVAALEQDLKAMGKWEETAICIFTEFGRINFENSSGGTDHGKGSCYLLIGGAVNGGIYGNTPSETQLSKNWLDMEIDFRNVFAEAITWLGFDPDPIFPETYDSTPLNLF